MKVSLMVCTASLFAVYPVLAQRQDGENGHNGHHGHHGVKNGSDHSGHNGSDHSGDNDSDRSGHNGDDDDQGDDGQDNLVLATPEIRAAVANAAASVTRALSSGSLQTSAGAFIPVSAQANTYSVLIADPTLPASSAVISAALSSAGPKANAIVPSMMRSFAGLGSNPANLPSAISRFNRFTRAASGEFISNPPPEFLALHTVLAQLTAAAGKAK
jgi:enamine deaminase RidA (YjgF/YER057c/UK114 family)